MRLLTTSSSTLILGLAIAIVLGVAGPAAAANYEVNVSQGMTLKGAPLALRGYDPVSYFDGAPVLGTADHSIAHGGATYRFASKANLARFEKDPSHYLPQYGGYCAYGASLGAKFDGDPLVWKIVNDKLYLNLNPDIKKAWVKDIPGAVKKADAYWPKIRAAAPDTLKPQG